jgi:hypothetical protein
MGMSSDTYYFEARSSQREALGATRDSARMTNRWWSYFR